MDTEKARAAEQAASELDERMWSVVSFERCEAAGLTYNEAVKKLAELQERHVNGLCIVTDEAAERVSVRA